MADKKCFKEAKTFVSLLASRFKEDKPEIDSEELLSFFTDAVSNLPKSKVKNALQKEFSVHFRQLSGLLNSVSKSPKQYEDFSQKTFKLNLFSEEGLENVLKTVGESKTKEERYVIYKNLQACYPYLNNTKNIFSTLREDITSDDLSAVKKSTEMTIGCHTKKSILECLSFILEEFSTKYEAFIDEPELDAKTERSKVFQEALHRYIVLMNHRWNTCSDVIAKEDSYEDLMAAMLSLYTDMHLLSSSMTETSSTTTENLSTLIFAVLGHSPEHCMDVLLQVTQLDGHNGAVLMPLLRRILERNQGAQENTQYIKFVCLAKIGLRVCSTVSTLTQTRVSIRKVAEKQEAPARFVQLLSKHDKRLVDRLKLSRKMTANNVTAHLLGEQQEEDIEALLDLATETNEESDQQPQEDHGATEAPQGDHTGDHPLFFIDSAGHKDGAEKQTVDFEPHDVDDVVLHRQLTSIIGQLQEQSDSEEEEEINFVKDENVEQLFVIDKTPSKSKNKKHIQKKYIDATVEEEVEVEEEVICDSKEDTSSTPSPRKKRREMKVDEDKKDLEENKLDQNPSEIESKKSVKKGKGSKNNGNKTPNKEDNIDDKVEEEEQEDDILDNTEDTSSPPTLRKRRLEIKVKKDEKDLGENKLDQNPSEIESKKRVAESKGSSKEKRKSNTGIVTPGRMATRRSSRRVGKSNTAI